RLSLPYMPRSCCRLRETPAATTEISTLSLHDALPICRNARGTRGAGRGRAAARHRAGRRDRGARVGARTYVRARRRRRANRRGRDRKSTRLNSSHVKISYAVFCLKKKKKTPALYTPGK